MKRFFGVLAGVLAMLTVVSSAMAADPLTINGAGATFPYPLYSKWFYEYSNANRASGSTTSRSVPAAGSSRSSREQ